MSMYAVTSLKESIKVETVGVTTSLDLNWADGMIGAMAVFKDKESALDYVNGNESLLIKVSEVSK